MNYFVNVVLRYYLVTSLFQDVIILPEHYYYAIISHVVILETFPPQLGSGFPYYREYLNLKCRRNNLNLCNNRY